MVVLFQKFISESARGKRMQKNGKLLSKSSLDNYRALMFNLKEFEAKYSNQILINVNYKYTRRNFTNENNYYQKFYKQFTDYLYAKNCTDNYVGMLIKVLRSFFIYLNKAKGYQTGEFYKNFYARREDIPIIVFSQEQLRFLIYNKEFEEKLPAFLKIAKDIVVFGCTVGLRYSDLQSLKNRNLETIGTNTYIITKSKKTDTDTRIKIPVYAIDILNKYKLNKGNLLPTITKMQFNTNIKKIAELAGWTKEIGKERSKRGVRKEIKTTNGTTYRFCDLLSSHVMRKTAITTLLTLGMPEPLVRKISGHAANSKEFYKYVKYSESFLDSETDKAFARLVE